MITKTDNCNNVKYKLQSKIQGVPIGTKMIGEQRSRNIEVIQKAFLCKGFRIYNTQVSIVNMGT